MKHVGENVVRIEAEALRALADRLAGPMAGRFLGELLSPTAVVVKSGAIQKVMAALAELGLLAEGEVDAKKDE